MPQAAQRYRQHRAHHGAGARQGAGPIGGRGQSSGGALTIGIDAVAKAAPDGYTLGQGPVGALAITRHMVAKLYDIERDLQPVALVHYRLHASRRLAEDGLPFRQGSDRVRQEEPGELSNASSSNGSPGHVSGELFKHMTGTDIDHIPYKGGAPAIADLIAGNVQLMFESTNSIAPHVKAGRVRALAVTGDGARHPAEVPTLIEAERAGLRGKRVERHCSLPPACRAVLDKLNAAVNRRCSSPTPISAGAARQRRRRRLKAFAELILPFRKVGRGRAPLRREDRQQAGMPGGPGCCPGEGGPMKRLALSCW